MGNSNANTMLIKRNLILFVVNSFDATIFEMKEEKKRRNESHELEKHIALVVRDGYQIKRIIFVLYQCNEQQRLAQNTMQKIMNACNK